MRKYHYKKKYRRIGRRKTYKKKRVLRKKNYRKFSRKVKGVINKFAETKYVAYEENSKTFL